MGALLLSNFSEQMVRGGISGRAHVEVVHLIVLSRLAGRQQPVDGGDARLQPQPQRQPYTRRIRDRDLQLLHALLEPLAMTALSFGHPPEDFALSIGQPARYQVIHRSRDDLALPRLQQAFANLW